MTDAILFLDLDGVIYTQRSHVASGDRGLLWRKPDPVSVAFVNKLCAEGEASVVVISDQRLIHPAEELLPRLRRDGIKANFHEDPFTESVPDHHRGDEVALWLERHPEIKRHVILDDDAKFHPEQPRIKTDMRNGILVEHFLEAADKLGRPKTKKA
jgi:hypothetical protein